MSSFVKDYSSSCLLVSVEGNIGSGKSTFLSYCGQDPTFEVLQEPIAKWSDVGGVNLLESFYKDPKTWAYPFQMEVLMSLFGQYTSEPVRPIRMVERSLWSARYCFQRSMAAAGSLDSTTSALLDQFHDTVASHWRAHPHAIVYLTTSPEVSYQRLRARGRPEEMSVSLQYLQDLDQYHQAWLWDLQARNMAEEADVPIFTIGADRPLPELHRSFDQCMSNLRTLLL